MKERIAIIPARGGSKRIPKKNIKEFMGKPMLAYAIEAAKLSGLFDVIMVSTDDEEIANVARCFGADVPFMRTEKTSSDTSTTFDVLEEVILEYKRMGDEFLVTCCIYPCVPFLKPETLVDSLHQMTESFDALMPVCRYSVPIEWAFRIRNDNRLVPDNYEKTLIRSQDIEPSYHDVGMFYYYRTDELMASQGNGISNTKAYLISEFECQDIDTVEDWKLAELKFKLLKMR